MQITKKTKMILRKYNYKRSIQNLFKKFGFRSYALKISRKDYKVHSVMIIKKFKCHLIFIYGIRVELLPIFYLYEKLK